MLWILAGACIVGAVLGCTRRVTSLIIASAITLVGVILFGIATGTSIIDTILSGIAALAAMQFAYLAGLMVSGGPARRNNAHQPAQADNADNPSDEAEGNTDRAVSVEPGNN